ncbi:hypothetical protein Ade02nite_69020 [Paractinoplanes deccanensis]|uniref:Uncharacterized protein n=1 Tax=Paractinoplanes deccanensis TaxID=113561 RepID=A0ABQ3YE26_9ACTN|nr:hypothetical protein Ade02nite_69020 [Actinoplanes deccanensis]
MAAPFAVKVLVTLPWSLAGRPGPNQAGRLKAVAAAKYAATGDLKEAYKRTALAYLPKNPSTTTRSPA